jgi:dienelactone hydrolase
VWDVPAGILAGLLFVSLCGLGLILLLKLLNLLPRFLGWLGFAAGGVLVLAAFLGFGFPPALGAAAGIGLACLEGALGGCLALLLGKEPLRPAKRVVLGAAALAAVAANVWILVWLAGRGGTGHLVKVKPLPPVAVPAIQAADPGQPGPYRVLTLTYGSGTDRWRPEFGERAALKTKTVDATPFVTGNEGWTVAVRKWYWGFGFKAFPLNGRVWYPDAGDRRGPFPLVLVVHGNHDMNEFSDPGYAYLGELLASRGFIAVSVDENFFNGFWSGGIDKENDGRGWLLLKHLEVWRDWSRTPGNPFQGKVDMERIALIGHSRGGEAVAIAAAFNRLPKYPDDADVPLGFGFGIRAVVAIAPIDGQYKPAGKPTPVSGVSYLVLQGAHDGDVSSFSGERQYQRLELDSAEPYAFKAALYIYRANHGQFNTVWGDGDAGWPRSMLLDRGALLDPEAQRRIAKVAISAFLEATLHGERSYVQLFHDLRSARGWLPEDLYISQFQDTTFRPVATFEEDVDVTTATLPGATLDGRGLALWKEQDLQFRQGRETQKNQALYLGWEPGPAGAPAAPASYTVRLPQPLPAGLKIGSSSSLVLSLADADQEPPDPKEKKGETLSDAEKKAKAEKKKKRSEREEKEGKEPLDLTVELVAADGTVARLPLSHFRPVPVPLESHFTKLSDESDLYGKAWEPVLQTFELPLAAFAAAKPGFTSAALREIRLVFDRSPEGVVILDDLGFAEAGGAANR